MPRFAAPATIMPPYMRAPVVPSASRRAAILIGQLLLAAACGVAAVALPAELRFLIAVPVVICLLFALWMMPDRGVFPMTAIERTFRFLFVLMVIWPSYLAVVLPGLPWLTPTRLTLFFLTFIFMYSVATSSHLRRHIAVVALSSKPLWIAFLLYQVAQFITLPLARHLGTAVKAVFIDEMRLTEMFFLSCFLFVRRGAATRTIGWLITLAVICAFEGLVEWHMQHVPWADHIPSFLKVDEALLGDILSSQARPEDGIYRVRGPFVNSLVFAEFLALSLPFALHFLFTARTWLVRLAMAAAVFIFLGAIIVTQSRLGLVGGMVGMVVYVPLLAYRRWRADRTSIIGPSILFGAPIIALGIVAVVFSSHRLTMRVLGGGAQQSSNEGRSEQLHLTIPKVLANPVGYGRTSSGEVIGYVTPGGRTTVDNHYLSTVIDLGLVGLFGFYGMFVIAAWMAARQFLSGGDRETDLAGPLAATLVVFLVIKWVLSEEYNHGLAMIFIGMVLALRARNNKLPGQLRFSPNKELHPVDDKQYLVEKTSSSSRLR